jgi:uncharacterized membrane protein
MKTLAFLALISNHVAAFAPMMLAPKTKLILQHSRAPQIQMFEKPKDSQENILEILTPTLVMDRQSTDPTPFFYSLFEKMTEKQHLQMVAAAMAFGLTFLPLPSDAASSGGRMGGSFSARPSQSRSYGGGRGYRGGGGYSGGGSYYSRPSVIIAPTYIPSPMISPFGYGLSPFRPPMYSGGPGVITYNQGPSFFDLVFFGGLAFALVSFFRNASQVDDSPFDLLGSSSSISSSLGPGTAVVQLSIALEVPNRDDPNSILGVLGRLANSARTDSRVGVQNLTSQVALEILRKRSSIVSAGSSYQHFGDRAKAQREFQSRSIKERSKFESETVSKYGGVDYSTRSSSTTGEGKATMAVVTLVLAIDGDSINIAKMNSISDVEDALRRIASDAKVDDCLQSAEILWTPEDRSETLTLRDVVADYPELRSV